MPVVPVCVPIIYSISASSGAGVHADAELPRSAFALDIVSVLDAVSAPSTRILKYLNVSAAVATALVISNVISA